MAQLSVSAYPGESVGSTWMMTSRWVPHWGQSQQNPVFSTRSFFSFITAELIADKASSCPTEITAVRGAGGLRAVFHMHKRQVAQSSLKSTSWFPKKSASETNNHIKSLGTGSTRQNKNIPCNQPPSYAMVHFSENDMLKAEPTPTKLSVPHIPNMFMQTFVEHHELEHLKSTTVMSSNEFGPTTIQNLKILNLLLHKTKKTSTALHV